MMFRNLVFLRRSFGLGFFVCLAACTTGNCRQNRGPEDLSKPSTPNEAQFLKEVASSKTRVRIAKPDGSLQCQPKSGVSVEQMRKELAGVEVFSASRRRDSLFRTANCDSPTGFHNVYEIDRKDLQSALKLKFVEWAGE